MTPQEQTNLLERIAILERRLLALESCVFKRGGLAAAVRRVISQWPGEFTATEIRDAVFARQPELKPATDTNQVPQLVNRMHRNGQIVCTIHGGGPRPNYYKLIANPQPKAGKPGRRFGSGSSDAAGCTQLIRLALDDMPREFTIHDLKRWALAHEPRAKKMSPALWHPTLRRMEEQCEIKVVRPGKRGVRPHVYTRAERRIAPSGDEMKQMEANWHDYRAAMGIQRPADFETPLAREEITI